MNRIVCIIFLVTVLVPIQSLGGEMYVWTDEQGNRHITDHPPDQPGKVITKNKFQEMTDEEIYEANKEKARRDVLFQKHEQQRRKTGEREAEARAAREAQQEREKAYKQARVEQARRDLQDLEARKQRYQYYENNSHSESGRMYWRDEVRKIDRSIKDNKKYIHDATWQQ